MHIIILMFLAFIPGHQPIHMMAVAPNMNACIQVGDKLAQRVHAIYPTAKTAVICRPAHIDKVRI